MSGLRSSCVAVEGPLQVAKWLHLQLLVDEVEMADLLASSGGVRIFHASGVVPRGSEEWDRSAWLALYAEYVESLRQGELPEAARYRAAFSSLWSMTTDILYAVEVAGGRSIVRATRPVVQLQWHQLGYSSLDGKFRPMVLGVDSILWGLQISYPQVFQDPKTKRFAKVDDSGEFPNTPLFRAIQRWSRRATKPTPFQVGGERTRVPMRLGRRCFEWIDRHPQLTARGIHVVQE